MKPIIYPYKVGSHAARNLASALGTLCVREAGTYSPKPHHLIINYGNPRRPKWAIPTHRNKILNHWDKLEIAQCKLNTFRAFEKAGVKSPEWTTDQKVAEKWSNDGVVVVCRKLLSSHSGNGIVIAENKDSIVRAPLYTAYKKKAGEFRVHVFLGKVIDVQQKRRQEGAKESENYDPYVRSHHHGWVYCREGIVEPKGLRELAVAAIQAVGLDFGAADIIWNKKENQCYCLEVNTAPGLEGTTLENYKKAIQLLC